MVTGSSQAHSRRCSRQEPNRIRPKPYLGPSELTPTCTQSTSPWRFGDPSVPSSQVGLGPAIFRSDPGRKLGDIPVFGDESLRSAPSYSPIPTSEKSLPDYPVRTDRVEFAPFRALNSAYKDWLEVLSELDGLAMWCIPIGFSPGFFAFEHRRRIA